jgi:hypothetical protein
VSDSEMLGGADVRDDSPEHITQGR